MAKTRRQREEKAEKHRAYMRTWRASHSPEKQATQKKESSEIRKIVSKIDRDRRRQQQLRLKRLNKEAREGQHRIEELRRVKDELVQKYVLSPEEPELDTDHAKAAEEAFERAYASPGALKDLTYETLEEFDELWRLVAEPLTKINYRGEKRRRSPASGSTCRIACNYSLRCSFFDSILPMRCYLLLWAAFPTFLFNTTSFASLLLSLDSSSYVHRGPPMLRWPST
jgi:hypothetical protein